MNTFPLEDKLILITGGLGGYGTSICKLMVKRGAKLKVCDLAQESEGLESLKLKIPEDKHQNVEYSKLDISNQEAFSEEIEGMIQKYGHPPDVIVNCASIINERDWKRTFEVNLFGAQHAIELGLKHLSTNGAKRNNGPGIVLNVSDIFGLTCKLPYMKILPAYTASKHAVTSLTRSYGSEYWYKKTGVKIIAVAPHIIDTPFLKDYEAPLNPDEETNTIIENHLASTKALEPDEAALKLINVLNAETGSVWYLSPNQLQPANIPDYVLPKIHMNNVAPKTFGVFGINYGMSSQNK